MLGWQRIMYSQRELEQGQDGKRIEEQAYWSWFTGPA